MVQEMCDTITLIQPKGSGGGGGATRENTVYNMSTDMLSKLPSAFNAFEVKERYRDKKNK